MTGPAGAGKGSLAKYLAIDHNIPHISTGDIFRSYIKAGTALGREAEKYISKGLLVPDEITVDLVEKRLLEDDCKKGYILDGFPRTLNQAELLAEVALPDYIIQIDVSPETVLKRLGGRYVCKKCGQMHNVLWHKLDKCRDCGDELYQRDDDREEIILKRLEQHNREFSVILKFYQNLGIEVLRIESKIEYSPENIYEAFCERHAGKSIVKKVFA
jgi:adenylate kinase